MSTRQRRLASEAGVVEVVAPAVLVGISATLLVLQAWAVLDARIAAQGAAHQGGRALAAATVPDGRQAAREAARAAYAGTGRDPASLSVEVHARDGRQLGQRCAIAVVTTSAEVRAIRLPFLGPLGPPLVVHGHDRELVEPFRPGRIGSTRCAA